jgi:hypothetical protein
MKRHPRRTRCHRTMGVIHRFLPWGGLGGPARWAMLGSFCRELLLVSFPNPPGSLIRSPAADFHSPILALGASPFLADVLAVSLEYNVLAPQVQGRLVLREPEGERLRRRGGHWSCWSPWARSASSTA